MSTTQVSEFTKKVREKLLSDYYSNKVVTKKFNFHTPLYYVRMETIIDSSHKKLPDILAEIFSIKLMAVSIRHNDEKGIIEIKYLPENGTKWINEAWIATSYVEALVIVDKCDTIMKTMISK